MTINGLYDVQNVKKPKINGEIQNSCLLMTMIKNIET